MESPEIPQIRSSERPVSPFQEARPGMGLVAVIALAQCAVGVISAFSAMTAVGRRDFTGGGVCFLASAMSFGLLVSALLRR